MKIKLDIQFKIPYNGQNYNKCNSHADYKCTNNNHGDI